MAQVAGLFVEHATNAAEAEAEAKEEMVRAVSDDMEYWGRISSAVLHDESKVNDLSAKEEAGAVAPEFRAFALHWVRCGRSLELIHSFDAHVKLMNERFERKQQRKVDRADRAATLAAIRAARGSYVQRSTYGGYGSYCSAITPEELLAEVVDVSPSFDVAQALTLLQGIDDIFLKPLDGLANALPELEWRDQVSVASVFDHMMHCFKHASFKKRYGYQRQDHTAPALVFGSDVPSYFANVTDQSIYRRKVLSMAGLRNLVKFGPVVYEQLKRQQFHGSPDHYPGDTGLSLMRRVTGNVVDLDTTVLRCTCKATLNAINASNRHKGEPVYASPEEFAKSAQAHDIALHCSLPLLDNFAALMGLKTDEDRAARRISAAQITAPFPVATGNTDRGRHPVWQYVNCGQNSFHCNVPNVDDVNGALLKAPYHCAQLWANLCSTYAGSGTEALLERMEDFFENCIVDSCFNMKWKSIEEYAAKVAHEGTIVDILQRAQMQSQAMFTPELFDTDDEEHTKETALMWSLVEGRVGKCVAEGSRLRPVTREDVAAWVSDPAVSI